MHNKTHKLIHIGRMFVAIAASWALGASFYLLFSPIRGRGVTSRISAESGSIVETFTTEQSWYEAQGIFGVLVLAIFSGLYLLSVRMAWRTNYIALTIFSVIAIALSVVAGFSIGGLYFPAAVGLLIGALILLSARMFDSG